MNAKWTAFGGELANKRTAAGVTIEDMARATKIRRSLIEALEAGRFDELPPSVFVAGFLKAYLLQIGDEGADRLAKRYHALLDSSLEDEEAEAGVARHEGNGRRLGILAVAAIALLLGVCGAAYWVWRSTGESRVRPPAVTAANESEAGSSALRERGGPQGTEMQSTDQTAPAPQIIPANAPAAKAEPTLEPPPSPQEAHPPADEEHRGLDQGDLVVVCDRPCWFELYEGGQRRVYRLLVAGERLAFRGAAFRANVGDASALELYWHGRRMDLPQGRGKVIRDLAIPPDAAPGGRAP